MDPCYPYLHNSAHGVFSGFYPERMENIFVEAYNNVRHVNLKGGSITTTLTDMRFQSAWEKIALNCYWHGIQTPVDKQHQGPQQDRICKVSWSQGKRYDLAYRI